RHEHIVKKVSSQPLPVPESYRPLQQRVVEELQPAVYKPRGMDTKPPILAPRSMESYNSIPLLERGLTDDEHDLRQDRNWSEHSILRGPSKERPDNHELTPNSSHTNSFNFVEDTDSLKAVGTHQPQHGAKSIDQSFLDDDSEASDLSMLL